MTTTKPVQIFQIRYVNKVAGRKIILMTDARNALDLEICAKVQIEKKSLYSIFELYVTRATTELVRNRIIWNANAKVFVQKKKDKEYKNSI